MKALIAIILIICSAGAQARTCWTKFLDSELARNTGKTEIEVVVERTPFIFIGEALNSFKTTYHEKGKEPHLFKSATEFEIQESIKGDLSGKVTIRSEDVCSCKYDFIPGVVYMVLAAEREDKIEAYNCTYIKPLEKSAVDAFKEAVSVNK
tara:strand:- start:1654 stop:2106 length:453 start_codon:yes stop_codon:yes gene_type:complete